MADESEDACRVKPSISSASGVIWRITANANSRSQQASGELHRENTAISYLHSISS
jgi:hypothetical protein